MMDDDAERLMQEEFRKSWDIAEAVLHDVLLFREEEGLRRFYEFVQHLRTCDYELWLDALIEVSDLRLIRGNSYIDFDEDRMGAMTLSASINGRAIDIFVNPIAFTCEVKALLELLMLQPLE